jgi:FixJ family two-component response regulator
MDLPNIAIVDDDEPVRCATASLVQSLGYNAFTFGSAEEFLKSETLDDTSCLVTDLHMPGLSGLELQDRLIARGRRIPIIFITAYSNEKVRTRAMNAGALGFLSKPYNQEQLLGFLDKALKGH